MKDTPDYTGLDNGSWAKCTPTEPFENIFKKSEHEEVMDKLNEIERKLDDFPRVMPIIPYLPYVSPWIRYPHDYDYPKPYYYGYEIIWTEPTSEYVS